MNQLQIWQVWLPPMLAVIGSLIVVVLAAWMNTRAVSAMIEAQGAKTAQQIAEFELRLTKQLLELSNRVAHLEEQRGIVFTPGH